jgi:Zn finger protein HypA/HybF involved in hydrogenase expression
MPHQITADVYPDCDRWTAHCTIRTVTVRLLTWTCPDCGTSNTTKLWPDRVRNSGGDVEGRCGKCHGQARKLLTRKDFTIDT